MHHTITALGQSLEWVQWGVPCSCSSMATKAKHVGVTFVQWCLVTCFFTRPLGNSTWERPLKLLPHYMVQQPSLASLSPFIRLSSHTQTWTFSRRLPWLTGMFGYSPRLRQSGANLIFYWWQSLWCASSVKAQLDYRRDAITYLSRLPFVQLSRHFWPFVLWSVWHPDWSFLNTLSLTIVRLGSWVSVLVSVGIRVHRASALL